MAKRITIIDGHPDPDSHHFVHALADSYGDGARIAGHEVRRLDIASMHFALIASRNDWEGNPVAPEICDAQDAVRWANHLAIFYPLWLGDVPALLKGFFEQVMRPGFAFRPKGNRLPEKLLRGRSAHLIVTMGMPAIFYRLYYGAHSVKSLERNVLRFVGIRPVHHTLIGNVEGSATERAAWLDEMFGMGEAGA
ncbi:dehydrogenase [Sphingomonas oleivorans]|uniref:Dehydrogenase n=1 Tax=Sphingomonas oleivorans TaxID=1735121 RepID=A0A2T5FYH3_9SPHN|nr:NAD(P)H-dependent oxidoreductase [Sphingomonas oleivorans]PTQ11587.1 dehydrogenase [Sphingomonas oleivorans]